MPKTNPAHGGRRKNAGRKPKPEKEKRFQIALKVPPEIARQFRSKARKAKLKQVDYFIKLVKDDL